MGIKSNTCPSSLIKVYCVSASRQTCINVILVFKKCFRQFRHFSLPLSLSLSLALSLSLSLSLPLSLSFSRSLCPPVLLSPHAPQIRVQLVPSDALTTGLTPTGVLTSNSSPGRGIIPTRSSATRNINGLNHTSFFNACILWNNEVVVYYCIL
jgi:hypothetical protein